MRHGQTDWNVEGRAMGQMDIPLNATGMQQAQLTAQYFDQENTKKPFDAIYTSDLSRAHKTARPIAEKINVTLHPDSRLREKKGGIWEGLTADEGNQKYPHLELQKKNNPQFIMPGSESHQELAQRTQQALQEYVVKYNGKRIIVVTHGKVLNSIHHWINGAAAQARSHNACISLITVSNGIWKIAWWAQNDHLKGDKS